jgi:hypothetical protein
MLRSIAFIIVLASSSFAVQAQSAGTAAPGSSPDVQTQPAPVVRANPGSDGSYPGGYGPGVQDNRNIVQVNQTQPIAGVILRAAADASVQTVSANAQGTELRVEHGRANVSVHRPTPNSKLLVDLPGGQVSLLKDGLYTFNADTNTVRVLKGEADAYPGPNSSGVKGIKVKEDHQVVFTGSGSARSVEANPWEVRADLLPLNGGGNGEPSRGYGYSGYGYGPYGYYGYPVYPGYAWGYPGWGYPYGYGYGVGLGYYGGFGGGRGGFRR